MSKKAKVSKALQSGLERRRTVRIRRSSLVKGKLEGLEKPSLKIAETRDELEQAFRIVYTAYRELNYIPRDHESGMFFNVYSLLPSTCIFIFKEYLNVISTMTYIPDSEVFGLPMDAVYKPELDALRSQGRKVAEVGALVTPKRRRWINLITYLAKALFQYAHLTDVDDICIMVNPKHVRFYKEIFLFQEFGEERWYESVGAPAVALRVSMDEYDQAMTDAYGQADFDTDLLHFFTKVNNVIVDPNLEYPVERMKPLGQETLRHFLTMRPDILDGFTPEQRRQFRLIYHDAIYAQGSLTH